MGKGKIEILPDAIAQKIAAGEVIERPASVVKELVENAIDAGSSEIVIELQSGGLQLIRVADNGEGMVPEDVPLALQRFATSKIRRAEDLYAIQTMGFRGEALPSIASVSQLILKTRHASSMVGTRVVCEGGQIISISEMGFPVGTEVEVRQLFYNFPVRRKFLKSIRTELRYSLLLFHRISLAYPSITFRFFHDGRKIEEYYKSESFIVRIEAIFGKEISNHLKPFQSEDGDYFIEGFVSPPTVVRGDREGISIYVNQRYIKDRILSKAVIEAYRHFLPMNQYPLAILFIRLPPSSVDVNVHPTKAEVKFKDPEKVYQTVFSAIRRTLEETSHPVQQISFEQSKGKIPIREYQEHFPFEPSLKPNSQLSGEESSLLEVREGKEIEWESSKEVSYRILGQLWGTYILCETQGALVFIDQHAAHERILFEKLKKNYEEKSPPSRPLLVPILVELSLEEELLFDTAKEVFETIGFEMEPVGERLYAIRSIPSFVEQREAERQVKEMLEELSFFKKGGEATAAHQSLLISLACHSAVRANLSLKREEIEALLSDLYPFNPAMTCPHGRPIFFFISFGEMNRKFKRG